MKKLATAIVAMFAALTIARAQADIVEKVTSLRVDADVRPAIGQFVPGDDDVQHLAYELLITNWQKQDLRFASVEIEDAATGKRLVKFDSKSLEDPIRINTVPFSGGIGPDNRVLRSGRTAVMAIDVKLPLGARLPAAIRHRFEFESNPNLQMLLDDGSESSELFAFTKPMPIDRRPPLVIGPPVRGGPWRCGNGFSGGGWNAHDSMYTFGKKARIHLPQRFGCDFRLVDQAGEVLRATGTTDLVNSQFYGQGADVIAVADGLVVDTLDGVPENVPRVDGKVIPPVPLTEKTWAGNIVALEIGKGQYAFYAHLVPGSIRVKKGDRVRKGQVLGKVGNSGNSVGPHLHFQVSRGPELNGHDFLPHIYSGYVLGGYERDRKLDLAKRTRFEFKRRRMRFRVPMDGAFMTFPR
ncbi:MAG TPA: M23 family metallopeptidase [Pyrinomonadaceae bacterium]|nr:M23 family metallopeptidase [Pyrinomonadaceae bacterium]